MATGYTYDPSDPSVSSATLDKPTLTGSTIANCAYVTEDPYLRVLSAKNGGTFNSITVGSGGTMYLSGGADVTSITLNGANSAYLRMSGGGVVTSLTMSGGSYHGFGAVVSNIYISGAANTANRAIFNMYWNAARISGGYAQNVTMNLSCGSAVNVTFDTDTYINVAGSGFNASGAWTAGGNISGGRAQNGASIRLRQSGGYVSGMTFDNATLEQYCLGDVRKNLAKGLTFTNGAKFNNGLTSGNTNYSGGIASDLTFVSQSFMQARNGADVTIASFDAESYLLISGGATVKTVTLTDSSYVKVSSGAVLSGATVGENCYVQVGAGGGTVSSGGWANDITIQSGGTLSFVGGTWKNNWNDWFTYNQFASNVTIQSGGTAAPVNYAMLMNVNAEAGAKITRGANLIGLGGDNTNIAKGVIADNELGDDFQVVGGTATGMDLATNAAGRSAFLIFSGLTVSGATVSAGGSLFLFDGAKANGVDVYGTNAKDSGALLSMWQASASNVGIGSGGKLIVASTGAEADNVSVCHGSTLVSMTAGTISGLVMSGGTLTTAQNSNKKYIYNVDITKAASNTYPVINISSGTYLSGGSIYGSAQFNLRYGVVEDVHFGADTWNNIYVGGSILGGVASMGADMRMGYGNSGALIDGMLFLGNAKVHLRDTRATVKNLVMSGNSNGQIDVSGGVVSSATLWNGSLIISGGSVVSGTGEIILGKGIANDTLIRSNGKYLQSGGTTTNTSIYRGGSGFYLYDDFDYDGQTVVSNLTMVGVGVTGDDVSSGCAWGYMYGGLVSGGEIRRTIFVQRGGTIENVNFGEKTWLNASTGVASNCGASNGGELRALGAEFIGVTLTDSGTIFDQSQGAATDVTILAGASMRMDSGATVTSASVANGAAIRVNTGATANSVSIASGGTMFLSGTAKINELNAAAGAYIALDITGKTAGVANFDSLANVEKVTIQNNTPATGTYTLADVGNTALKVGIVGSRVFDGEVAAGGNYVDPFISREFALNAAGTELTVAAYTRTSTGEAATFAQSGSVINGGDKALEWKKADITGKIELLAASDTVAGNAWLDIRSGAAISGAQIFGTAENVTFGGKISYQIHGTGGTIGNLAAGANYGGSVKGVDILAYGNTFNGVGYAGGFGTVGEDGVQVVFGSNNGIKKDFYGGALYNAAKVAAGTTTSVSTINMQFGENEKGADGLVVEGNIYGGGAVKAGTITTTGNTSALQTVGDITLTLSAGTATKGAQACVFAGGYATGHDTAKEAPVYTVESVTLNVKGGDWGTAAGGRGVFGGAMASDNIGSDGVYAMVGDVNISISGGTMGNVYGGGWAQKKAFSRVGDVYINISGGTIANVFGGGSTSTSGGSTQADDVTITVSGGTISGDIFARGQSATDVVNSAEVIFTGAADFTCNVWGYSYVGEAPASDATLSFSDYTGAFSGEIGGFADITVGRNSWMTLGTAADGVNNTAWIFDFNERDLGLDGQAALTWSTADFKNDTVTLRIASGARSEGWTLVSGADASKYNTAADKFLVEIDGAEAVALTFDATTGKTGALADGAYQGWGFAVENSVLKFKNLA